MELPMYVSQRLTDYCMAAAVSRKSCREISSLGKVILFSYCIVLGKKSNFRE